MRRDTVVLCPDCSHPVAIDCPGEQPSDPQWRQHSRCRFTETACDHCGREFAVDEHGDVHEPDDADHLRPDETLCVDDDGELVADTYALSPRCPRCCQPVDVGETGPARCPHCRHAFVVVADEESPLTDPKWWDLFADWEEEQFYYGEYECPACGNTDGEDCFGFIPLSRGWVQCGWCRAEFDCQPLYDELIAGLRDQRADLDPGPHVVAPDGGDFDDLTRAVQRLGGRGHLILRPGRHALTYQDGCPDLTIEGDGPAADIVIHSRFRVAGGRLRVSGITFEGPADVENCRATFRNCRFGNAAGTGLSAYGFRAKIRAADCSFSGCGGPGLTVHTGSCVRLSRCSLTGNASHGVLADRNGWLRLRGCEVTGNRGHGVLGRANSSIFVHDSRLTGNAGSGLRLRSCRAVVRSCLVDSNHGAGLSTRGRTRLYVSRSNVSANGGCGVALGERGRALVRRCGIINNGGGGRSVAPSAAARWCACRFEQAGSPPAGPPPADTPYTVGFPPAQGGECVGAAP